MSTYKAIAGVSSTLKALLRDRMTEVADITLAPPDVKVDSIGGRRLNLYLYHVSENPFLKNQEIAGGRSLGSYGHPPLSVDMRYICTAFGSTETGPDADIEAQRILGDAMRVLHDCPVITPDLVEEKKPAPKPPVLDASLIGEFEQVKITWQPAALEEISKVWTALPNVNFRRSVLYEVSVVQIQSKKERSIALPVKTRRVYTVPMRTPLIEQVFLHPPIGTQRVAAVEEGETLRLIGTNLKGDVNRVGMNGVEGTITSISDTQIDVVVPVGRLKIGLQAINVEQDVLLNEVDGQPPVQRPAFRSNLAAFVLLPKLGTITPPGATAGDRITVPVQPEVTAAQEKLLLLGDIAIQAVPMKFNDPPSATIQFVLPKAPDPEIPPGTYLARLRVDGAESRLTVNPVTLEYNGPNYTVT